jgi:Tfp pilus assembly protein PilF
MTVRPAAAEELFFEGTRLMGEGDSAGAELRLRDALSLAPDFAEAHANLALLLDDGVRGGEAEHHYRQALECSPRQAQTYLNFGALLAAQRRFAEAEAAYRQALLLDPQLPGAWSNLGVLLVSTKREADAERCYRVAIDLAPDYGKARFNLAYLLLRQGRYEEGWACLEARDWSTAVESHLQCPRWRGEPLVGRSVLIGIEAGHGDMIQFCRYAAVLKARGAAKVSVLCHPALATLFVGHAGVDEVVPVDKAIPASGWDYWVPPLSLPFLCQTRLDTIPADLPYLTAEPERVGRWRNEMACPEGELRIGLAWKGNPRFENDVDRSLPSLAVLAPLADIPGVRFFSLQKGVGQEEAQQAQNPLSVVDLGSRIGDFADTAAIMMNLDLVITVDTAVAHLAGALARPCWVLLPDYQTDWRWLADRVDSPWYPGVMRLFRQRLPGDWTTTIADVKAGLMAWLAAGGASPARP